MKRSTKLLTAASVFVLGIATVAGTGNARGYGHKSMGIHHGGHGMRMMERFDNDGDGKVTAEEMVAVRDKAMANYDANKDGNLSIDEFQGLWLEHMRPRMVRHFQRLDADGDAKLTQVEMKKIMQRIMSRMDRDNDGAISKDDRRGRGRHHDDNHRRRRPNKD
jgi:hypothetical protein